MEFETTINEERNIVIIRTPPRFTVEFSTDFKELMTDFVNQKKYRFIVDLSETIYMDSSGLGAIVSRIAVCRSNNGDIRLTCPTQNVIELLELTNLVKILNYYKTLDEGINSFN